VRRSSRFIGETGRVFAGENENPAFRDTETSPNRESDVPVSIGVVSSKESTRSTGTIRDAFFLKRPAAYSEALPLLVKNT
jgi:hypothetical protein